MNWRKPSEEPEDRQTCSIVLNRGFACTIIIEGVAYIKDHKSWMDIFATPAAGAMYKTGVVAWVPSEELPMPPDEWFDE